jgi:hypothetical protein
LCPCLQVITEKQTAGPLGKIYFRYIFPNIQATSVFNSIIIQTLDTLNNLTGSGWSEFNQGRW